MKRKVLLWAFLAAVVGTGCSALVSYDGYGDGTRAGDDGGSDGTVTADGDTTNEGGGGGDSSTEDSGDAAPDALDGGTDGATKKHALVLLGGEVFDDAGSAHSVASVEIAMINADGTLGPWMTTTPMTETEDEVGATAWGSSIFIMDDFGGRAAVVQPDGGISSWQTIANVNRNSPRLAAVDGRLYVAGGTAPGGAPAPEVYYATITGPTTIGTWTATSSLGAINGGPRNDTTMVTAGKMLYLVGGDDLGTDTKSVVSAPIDGTGGLGPWVENTPLPTEGDHTRTVSVNGRLVLLGGSFDNASDRNVYSSLVGDGGVLGPWDLGSQHPVLDEPCAAAHNGFVYLISGRSATAVDTPAVYFTAIEPGGFPGAWQTTSNVKVPRHNATAVVVEVP